MGKVPRVCCKQIEEEIERERDTHRETERKRDVVFNNRGMRI